MTTFTKIPNEISTIFSPNDVYTLTVMYIYSKYDEQSRCFVTNSSLQQLADKTGLSFAYMKDKFLPRLKASKFCKIELINEGYKEKRNKYYLPDTKSNFRIINSRVITDNNLSPNEKGFLISLFTKCENNSFNCGLEVRVVVELLKEISKTTYNRHKNRLIEKGYIKVFDDVDLLDEFNYSSCLEIDCNWIGSTSDNIENLRTEAYTKASTFLTRNSFNFSIAV